MIAKNAEKTINNTLKTIQAFNEVILYLNDCSDQTEKIAKNYSNVKIIHGDFLGFGPTKNKATTHATNDWIFSLDSDECLTESFVKELEKKEFNDGTVYTILRTNYYKSTQIKHCWGDDIIVRLYNRNKTKFTDKKVHEKIIDNGLKKEMLEGIVEHYPYSTQTDFIVKLDRYSTIFAQDNVGEKSSSPLKAILNAHFSFFKTYFLKRGFLDGSAGLIIAFSHMATNFYKYMKLYEMNKELKK
jgi:glycosyltransferase involved in cell wall biosynthesis